MGGSCVHTCKKPPYLRGPLLQSVQSQVYTYNKATFIDKASKFHQCKVYTCAMWPRNASLLPWHKFLFLFFLHPPPPFAESFWQGRVLVLTNQVPIRGTSTNNKQGFHKNTISRWCSLFAENPNSNHRNQHRRRTQFAKTTRPGSAILQCNSTITKARKGNV